MENKTKPHEPELNKEFLSIIDTIKEQDDTIDGFVHSFENTPVIFIPQGNQC